MLLSILRRLIGEINCMRTPSEYGSMTELSPVICGDSRLNSKVIGYSVLQHHLRGRGGGGEIFPHGVCYITILLMDKKTHNKTIK